MIHCLITDGSALIDEPAWLEKLEYWIERGVDLIQIREHELTTRQLATLTRKVLALPNPHNTKILLNDRADVAIACGAHGIHLRDHAPDTRRSPRLLMITRAAHHLDQLPLIQQDADYILLAPIFAPLSETEPTPPLGLEALREACRLTSIPILALGGITADNARQCEEAGAAGIAGISYFETALWTPGTGTTKRDFHEKAGRVKHPR